MGKFAVKLFRDLEKAERALQELRSRGYGPDEVSLLLRPKGNNAQLVQDVEPRAEIVLPEVGLAIATGPLAGALNNANGGGDGAAARLAQALELSPELYSFYEFGLSLGGVLLAVQADEGRLGDARRILRAVEAEAASVPKAGPGFSLAGRMTRTDPLDAKMSGDFRKY